MADLFCTEVEEKAVDEVKCFKMFIQSELFTSVCAVFITVA